MQPRALASLFDLANACQEMLAITGSNPDQLLSDRVVALAVERLFLIMGEALIRVRDIDPSLLTTLSDWKAVIGLRNAIVHGYDKIDSTRLRDAIRDDVPILLAEVTMLLPGAQGD